MGAPSPGFNVHDGVLTGLYGGVMDGGDTQWIDFFQASAYLALVNFESLGFGYSQFRRTTCSREGCRAGFDRPLGVRIADPSTYQVHLGR